MKSYFVCIFFLLILFTAMPAVSDTIYLNDGNHAKGIVVENYCDKIVISTFEGEIEIDKSLIKDIAYDRREQNLLKMGDYHYDKGNFMKAYSYYEKAYDINPDYKEASDKVVHMRSMLLSNPEKKFKDDMERRRRLFMASGRAYSPVVYEDIKTPESSLILASGMALDIKDQMPWVSRVVPFSPAQQSGIQQADIIYSLWGRLTGYLDLHSVIDMIVNSPSPEVILSIKRAITIPKSASAKDALGISLDINEQGLAVTKVKRRSAAERSGLRENDIIMEINGQPTRYMPVTEAISKMQECFAKQGIRLDILRETLLWLKEG